MSIAPGGVANALGNVFRTQKVQVGTIPFVSGGSGSIDIPRGLLLKGIQLRISGTATVGAAVLTSLLSENPLGLFQRVELTADGRKPFFSSTGRLIYRQNQITHNWASELSSAITTAVGGPYAFSAMITIDPAAYRTINPISSFLDTRLFDSLKLNLTFGTVNNLGVIGGGTFVINAGCTVDVQAEYTTEGFEHVQFNKVMVTDEIAITATQASLRLPVPRNGLLYSVLIQSDRDSVVDDALVNNVTLRSENNVYHMDHLTWATLQARNTQEFQLQTATIGGRVSGYAYHELAEDFQVENALDTSALNTLDLVFDVTLGAGTSRMLKILYTFYEPAAR